VIASWARLRAIALLGIACALSLGAAAQSPSPHTHQHGFHGAAEWARVFDDPKRDEWQKPHQVIESLALESGAVIADIGAGTGYFSSRFARMLPGGRIYAVDTEPDMVKYLAGRAQREGLKNLRPLQADPADPRLPETVDLVIFVDVYHHVESREAYLRRLRESLRPAGRVAVIDFRIDAPIGPPPSGRIPPQRVKDEFRRAGYALQREHEFLPYQYFLIFEPVKP